MPKSLLLEVWMVGLGMRSRRSSLVLWVGSLSSVEAWFATALDIDEVLSGVGRDQLHVMVADVIKSFNTVDRSILDCALGRFGLLCWFRRTYFAYKLATGLGESWCRDGGIPQGCPLSMVFIVALYVPWCRHLDSLLDVKPQLYADDLECSAERPRACFESARFTAQYVWSVGQDVSPGKCVLLNTSKSVRKAVKLWDISGDGFFWKVQLDARDLGEHLDFTDRARLVLQGQECYCWCCYGWCSAPWFSGQAGIGSG